MRGARLLVFVFLLVVAAAGWPADRAPLFAQLEKTRHIAEGAQNPRSVLYVFFDPNCYYCNLTWRALQPYERAGLQVRWVPVAYQKENSAGMAAAMMLAPDPAAALRENETRYKPENYDGGIKPLATVPAQFGNALKQNLSLMRRFGAPGTPALVWKDAKGRIAFRNAVPRLSELPRITGLPAQRIDDPDLADFR